MNIPVICAVTPGSPGEKAGIRPGDTLLSIGGHVINDVLDYKFYSYDSVINVEIRRNETDLKMPLKKQEGEDIGLEFETYLIDNEKSCSNKCIFCFIDQLPRGMRSSLYYKDDDARLSFLTGNYITMTNLSNEDVQRIVRMKISPLNISVHTTNPQLRTQMLGNPRGGESLEYMRLFAESGIKLNTQIVVCPGINDGEELRRTLRELSAMQPAVNSIAAVPVGLTRHRRGLHDLRSMDNKNARDVICIIDEVRQENINTFGSALCYASDELYLKAELGYPQEEYYEGYPQIENGVGLLRSFHEDFFAALDFEEGPFSSRQTIVVTASEGYMSTLVNALKEKHPEVNCAVYGVRNDFFGECVNVSGLITGGDIIAQLKGRIPRGKVLLPEVCLRHGEDVLLDDVSVAELERQLERDIAIVPCDGGAFFDAVTGIG